jgi:hypothetical protein
LKLGKKDEAGEYEETKNLSSQQMLAKQKNMLKEQDQQLNEIGNIVSNLRYENENFNQEVTYQNK